MSSSLTKRLVRRWQVASLTAEIQLFPDQLLRQQCIVCVTDVFPFQVALTKSITHRGFLIDR
jgi:hypothetical protein